MYSRAQKRTTPEDNLQQQWKHDSAFWVLKIMYGGGFIYPAPSVLFTMMVNSYSFRMETLMLMLWSRLTILIPWTTGRIAQFH